VSSISTCPAPGSALAAASRSTQCRGSGQGTAVCKGSRTLAVSKQAETPDFCLQGCATAVCGAMHTAAEVVIVLTAGLCPQPIVTHAFRRMHIYNMQDTQATHCSRAHMHASRSWMTATCAECLHSRHTALCPQPLQATCAESAEVLTCFQMTCCLQPPVSRLQERKRSRLQ
jgi:hypothetical protein